MPNFWIAGGQTPAALHLRINTLYISLWQHQQQISDNGISTANFAIRRPGRWRHCFLPNRQFPIWLMLMLMHDSLPSADGSHAWQWRGFIFGRLLTIHKPDRRSPPKHAFLHSLRPPLPNPMLVTAHCQTIGFPQHEDRRSRHNYIAVDIAIARDICTSASLYTDITSIFKDVMAS